MTPTGPRDAAHLAAVLFGLHRKREKQKAEKKIGTRRRKTLTPPKRAAIFAKTAGRCHICGGRIADEAWQADHVLAYSGGGVHSIDNYLPAHSLCNNYRWDYLADEFQWIMKLGVWARTQVERETAVGLAIAAGFLAHERSRRKRRAPESSP
jgi:5-methylcytosine-specific restriction endonuclease McrA